MWIKAEPKHTAREFSMFQHPFISLSFFVFFQLLQRVHGHEKELQNTQKINVSIEIRHHSRRRPVYANIKRPRAREQIGHHLLVPYRAEMCKADHPSAFSAPGSPDEGAGRFYLIRRGIQRRVELISSVWWDPTQKMSIYIQDRAKRKVTHEDGREGQYFASSTSEEGKLLSLAICKAGERASLQTISGPACCDPNKTNTRFFLFH